MPTKMRSLSASTGAGGTSRASIASLPGRDRLTTAQWCSKASHGRAAKKLALELPARWTVCAA